jgi:GT2 family glycosyltransferase
LELAAVVLTLGEDVSYRSIVADLLDQGVRAERICVVHNPVRADEPAPALPDGTHLLRMPRNVGYAAAMNAGTWQALERGADWIWLLTQDVRLRPGAADAMGEATRTSGYGALGPRLVQAGTDVVFSLGGARTRFGWPFNIGYGGRLPEGEGRRGGVERCAWLDGSSIMVRAEAVREVGLYDASLFGYAEDALFCLRLERAGWSTGVVQAAVAEQVSGQISRPGIASFLIARNCLVYAREVAGVPAVAATLARYLRLSTQYLRATVTGPGRRVALIRCYATWAGALAFFAGRMGPPPARLPGSGDLGGR